MKDEEKTKEQLIDELAEMRQRVAELEASETELKQAGQKLRHQKKHLESLIKYSPLAIVTLDESHNIISCNRNFEKLFQFEESEILGKNLDEVIAGHEYIEDAISYTKETLSGKVIHGSGKRQRKDGIYIDVEFFGIPVVIDGKVVGAYGIYQDISQRMEVEEALRESEEKYRTIFEESRDAIYINTRKGKFIDINQSFLNLFGYTREEITGLKAQDTYVNADDRTRFKKEIEQNGSVRDFELKLRKKDGIEMHCLLTATVRRAGDGSILGYQGIIRDITEKKKTEEALQESEAKYSALVENSKDGIIIIHEGVLKFINKASADIVGYSPKEMIGINFLNFAAPDYRELVLKRYTDRIEGKDVPSIYEIELLRKDGKTIPVELNAIRIDFEGKPADLAVIRDITERKKAEEALRQSEESLKTILNSIQAGIVIIDAETNTIVDANPAAIKMIGASKEEIIGHVCHKYICPAEKGKCPITDLGQEIDNSERILLTATGEEVPILKTVTPILLGGKEHLLDSFIDITEKKRLEAQLLQSQKMEAIGTLAGGVAHDFNNMLQAIFGYTQILLMGKEPSNPDYEKLEAIEKSAQRASDLTKQLLIFSRKVESKLRPMDLNHEVKQVEKLLKRTIPRMIKIELYLADDLSTVNADPAQMEQVMMNIGVNARDAMPEGGRLIFETENVILDEEYCKTHLGATLGDYVLFTVSDTGHGMDKETLEHIFEPFYTTKEAGKGTGLGLAMVYGIVKSHSGYIMCYSEPGEGTTFKIYLPTIKQETGLEETKEEEMPTRGTETVLLVDDEEAIRELGDEMLTRFGYTVFTAPDGESALEIYREKKEKIDLIILDLIMPGMGGRRCLEEILKINLKAKVVIASGYSVNGPTKEALKAGGRGFISKPYSVKQMLKAVREALDGVL